MTISDEKLNAFIDGELSALEMSIVRDAIAKDDEIAERADALAALNSQITASLSSIDAIPLSAGLSQLKSQLEAGVHTETADNVISLPWWRKAQAAMTMPTAIAASIAAIFGFFLNSETHTGAGAMSDWSAISQALSNQASGERVTTNNGSSFEARLTFLNQQGEYCRQFYIKTNNAPALQSIACRTESDWQLRAAMPTVVQDGYQTASNDRALDEVIDAMIKGDIVSLEQENKAIERRWKQ